MQTWRVQGGLLIMAAACIAGGILVPFVPATAGRDILAGGLVLGGLAMLFVAIWRTDGRDGD
jgi:hypothetical protein